MRGQRHLTAESAAVCLAGATVRLAWALALVRSLLGAAWVMPAGHRYPLWLAIVALVGAWALARLARHPRMATRLPGLMPLAVALGVALTVLSLTLQSDIDVRGIVLWARRVISGSAAPLVGVPAQAIVGVTTALLWREGLRVDWRDSEALWRSFQRGILG